MPPDYQEIQQLMSDWRFCVAPMMEWSDRHCRYFWRLMSRNARLYTEMVTTAAIVHGDRDRLLKFDIAEHPVALQLGGSDPKTLAACTRIAEDYGYDEINLNCGCPSDRVQEGRIGACLMAEPNTVADCVDAMRQVTRLPVTVKHRIGIDDLDSEEHLHHFVSTIAAAGCNVFIVHARKAWLQGLSPKQNREIPPLDYDVVARLKTHFPKLTIVINGGITSLAQSLQLLTQVDGVMLGREAYHNPFILADVDQQLFGGDHNVHTRDDILEAFLPYCEQQLQQGVRLNSMARHLMGLYAGQPGGRLFRRHLSDHATRPGEGIEVLKNALAELTPYRSLANGDDTATIA